MSRWSLSSMNRRLIAAAIAIQFALWPAMGRSAGVQDPLDCARARSRRSLSSIRDYQCDLTSYRKAWTLDGELDKDNVLHKKMYVKLPDMMKVVFARVTINGKPVDEGELLWEKLGVDDQPMLNEIEVLRPGSDALFKFKDAGTVTLDGVSCEVIEFESLKPGDTELQKGKMFLDPQTCNVKRLDGTMVNRTVQKNVVDIQVSFGQVGRDAWLPMEITVQGVVSMGPLKRRIQIRNVFSNYRLNVGLKDDLFD